MGPPTGWHRLRLLRQIGDQLVSGVEQFLLINNVVTVEDGAALVPGQEHGTRSGTFARIRLRAAVRRQSWRKRVGTPAAWQAVRHAVRQRRTGMSSRWKTSGLSGSRRARRRFSAFAMGGEMGRIRPTNVFERPGESRMTPPVTSMSSQVRSRISCLRQPAARRVRRRWWGRRFPTKAVRRGPDERRVGGRCQGRGPCEAWLGVHRRAVMPRTSFSTPRHVPSETLECHRSWPAM